jgi:hypothetical protein
MRWDVAPLILFYAGVPALIFYVAYRRWGSPLLPYIEPAELPEQPFKVTVAIEPMKDSALLGFARGRKLTQSLFIDVKIGQKDWQRIKDVGLMDATLFEHPSEASTYDNEPHRFPVKFLQGGPKRVCFYNISQAAEAKEELLKNIVNLKATVEAQKEGRQETSFEL